MCDRLLARGAAISDGSPAGALHRVRIDAKKLRYLLEFFRDRFRVERQVRALKRLQDNLGDLHDLQVQRAVLDRQDAAARTSAVDRLRAELGASEAIERGRFVERFAELRPAILEPLAPTPPRDPTG